jgi:hypothetical protein
MSLSVAQKYVTACSNLAREGAAVALPNNVGDMGGMVSNGRNPVRGFELGQRQIHVLLIS